MTQLVIALGNPDRGDDGVGLRVARALEQRGVPAGVDLVEHTDPTRVIDLWDGADDVVVVDAVHGAGPAGDIVVRDARAEPLPAGLGSVSSHAFSLAGAVELARALHRLPRRLTVVGIEAATVGVGADLSAPVAAAVGPAVDAVLDALGVASR